MVSRKRVRTGRSSREGDDDGVAPKDSLQVTTVRKSRKSGKLARMLELPLEVFTEIASYLSPYDILQIARSSKTLRYTFMSRRSKHVWVAARAFMGIPDHDDLTEPHYADLLFSKRCHGKNCDSSRATKVSFSLGVRLCKICFEQETITGNDVLCKWWRCLDTPYRYGGSKEISGLVPVFYVYGSDQHLSDLHFLKSSVEIAIANYKACKSEEDRERFISGLKVNTARLNEIETRIVSWERQLTKLKQGMNAELCIARRKSVVQRLLSMGYSSVDLDTSHDCNGWKWNSILDQPRPLTETIWKKILPQLEEILRLRMARHRRLRHAKMASSIKDRFVALWESRRQTDAIGSISPVTLHSYFPSLKAMLDNPDCLGPVAEYLLETLENGFEDAVAAHVEMVESTCAEKMKEACKKINKRLGDGTQDSSSKLSSIDSTLLYATSLFRIGKETDYYGTLISYAGILKYRKELRRSEKCGSDAWQDQNIDVPEGVVATASSLLHHMSLPETSSMLSLESLGKSFRCEPCTQNKECDDALTWSSLVWHFFEENTSYHDRVHKRRELNIDIPLRNVHDLGAAGRKNLLASMAPAARQIFESSPHSIEGHSYASLSEYSLWQWGYDTSHGYKRVYPTWTKDSAGVGLSDFDEEEIPVCKDNGERPSWMLHVWRCQWCEKLGIIKKFLWSEMLGKHLKRIHGVDFDGTPLTKKSNND